MEIQSIEGDAEGKGIEPLEEQQGRLPWTSRKGREDSLNKVQKLTEKRSIVPAGTLVSTWAKSSSIHGVARVQRSSHPLRRLVWAVIVLAGLGRWQFPLPYISP